MNPKKFLCWKIYEAANVLRQNRDGAWAEGEDMRIKISGQERGIEMLKIAICDDEKFYQDKIQEILKRYLNKQGLTYEIDLFLSGKSFLKQRENTIKYDVVFMDINMEEVDGLQTALKIREYHSETYIVFVTAFINYALEGYKVNAIRYIMKETLENAIPECMKAVLDKMQLRQITFPFTEGEKNLYTDNILYVESRKHKAVFSYLEEEVVHYQVYEKLDQIEEILAPYGFLRIHKSYLINMKHISKINNYIAYLDSGEQLPIPRLRFKEVKETFVAYKGAL